MITLAMDSAYKMLTVGLYQDGNLLAGFSEPEFKKQSEMIFPVIEDLLKKTGLDYKDLDEVVITRGPGSYTGIRIAMTIAKVLCTSLHIPLYTISTMELYAGLEPGANVILDARGKRAYTAHVENGKTDWMGIVEVENLPAWLDEHPGKLIGDAFLLEQEEVPVDFLANFASLRPIAREVENVHALVPDYLKESDAYRVG